MGVVTRDVKSIRKAGDTQLKGDVTLTGGTNITLTQSGQDISIASTSSGAPTDATYITQTANGTLSAEQALSTLSTGLMKVTTTTGVISSITDSAGLASVISDKTGSGALVFGTTPVFTTNISTPLIISSGAIGITPASGSNLNITLATTGDLVVNTNQLYVDTSAGNVGIGTTLPTAYLMIKAGTATANTAPIKLTSGVLNTTPEALAIETDGSDLYISF